MALVAPTARDLEAARLGGEGKPGARGVPLGSELGGEAGSELGGTRAWARARGYGTPPAPRACALQRRQSWVTAGAVRAGELGLSDEGDRSWVAGILESQTPELTRIGPPGKGKEAVHEVV